MYGEEINPLTTPRDPDAVCFLIPTPPTQPNLTP